MKNYIDQLEQRNRLVPKQAFAELAARQDEAVPALLSLVQKVTKHAADFEGDPLYNGHVYASFLLAQFREKSFLPVFLDFLSLPSDTLDRLYDDLVIESAGRILASVLDEHTISSVKQFIENDQIDVYARGAGLRALVILTLQGILDRAETLEYFRSLFHHPWKTEKRHMITEVIVKCDHLYPDDVYEEIKAAYQNRLVDEGSINLDDIHRTLNKPKNAVLQAEKADSHNQLIHDALAESAFVENMPQFDGSQPMSMNLDWNLQSKTFIAEPKTGRNEACPCGSGKKFKKCCGK